MIPATRTRPASNPASNPRWGGSSGTTLIRVSTTGHDPTVPPEFPDELDPDAIAPWDGRRVPVTLLGGYLGAGKTTVVNELLARTERPIAVLVNDVGQVNIDAALIRRRHGDTVELTDGCVCCSMSQGLVEAFAGLRARPTAPDQVVVELSGVAEPARVIPFANSDGFRLDGVVVLVDADQFLDRLDDRIVGPMVRAQLIGADVFALTKTDLVDGRQVDAVTTRLGDLAPGRPVLVGGSPAATAGFLNTGTRSGTRLTDTPTASLFDVHVTTTVPLPNPIDRHGLERILDDLGPRTLRAKGVAGTGEGERLLIQVVGNRRSISPLPAAEDQPTTDLVVISAAG